MYNVDVLGWIAYPKKHLVRLIERDLFPEELVASRERLHDRGDVGTVEGNQSMPVS